MKEKFIETENYIAIHELLARLMELQEMGQDVCMGLVHGDYGLGKTYSLERLAAETGAILLRTDQTWTVASVLRILSEEMGLDSRGKSAELMERIVWHMLREPRPIIIDEIDTLLPAKKFDVMEMFRDIHDKAHHALLFVGMQGAEARLKLHPHFYSRIVGKVKFKSISQDDIAKFCEQSEVKIEDDLVEYFFKKYPNLRRIKVFMLRIESWVEMNEVESMTLKQFKNSGVEYAEK